MQDYIFNQIINNLPSYSLSLILRYFKILWSTQSLLKVYFQSVLAVIFIASYPGSYEFISSTTSAGFTVISTHAGIKPLFAAFLADLMFDHAEQ